VRKKKAAFFVVSSSIRLEDLYKPLVAVRIRRPPNSRRREVPPRGRRRRDLYRIRILSLKDNKRGERGTRGGNTLYRRNPLLPAGDLLKSFRYRLIYKNLRRKSRS